MDELDRLEAQRRRRFEFAVLDDEEPPCAFCGHEADSHAHDMDGAGFCLDCERNSYHEYTPRDDAAQEAAERAYDAATERWERSREE